ncbi:MAG: hypothetical protein DRQ42_08215 [Gammaproteobacteria bacterium]|nr:MAG: hypothetical protein DRQ42_08215 [Gammaproteobacteria bacterium]
MSHRPEQQDAPICEHCESEDVTLHPDCGEYWCNACWSWSVVDANGEESREEIGRTENRIIDDMRDFT